MPRTLAPVAISLCLFGCAALPSQQGTSLTRSELLSVVHSVKERDGTCISTIPLITSCPLRYQNSSRGDCVLAFGNGKSVNDSGATFYTIYLKGGTAQAYEKVAGGHEDDPEIIDIISGCPY